MGSYRSQPDKTKHIVEKSHQTIQSCICHMCGWRLYMEDSSIEQFNFDHKNNHIFGVFDGHGGSQVSAFVQYHFVEQLLKNSNYKNSNYQLALIETFQIMDTLLKSKAGKEEIKNIQNLMKLKDNIVKTEIKNQAGCTAIVCLITDKFIYIANAGDSRAVGKINSKIVCLTSDHCPQKEQQMHRIRKAGGFVDTNGRINGCLNISRAIGDLDFKKNKKMSTKQQIVISTPDVTKILRQQTQMLIIGCDGIWEEKSQIQIVSYVEEGMKQNKKLSVIVQELFETLICKQQDQQCKINGKDNMTTIIINFKKTGEEIREQ